MSDERFGQETLNVINELNRQGISKLSVIMRHSARNYDEDLKMEPFMWLTEEGKQFATSLGENLPENRRLRFFSSYIGRCIESAYLIDKGYLKTGGKTENPVVSKEVSPFYVLDLKKTIGIIMKQDVFTFIRNWIDGGIDDSVLMNAEASARQMMSFMAGNLNDSPEGTLDICITHDWNMYLMKEFGLGLDHETYGKIDYLEGVVIFENSGDLYITNHQKSPERLTV